MKERFNLIQALKYLEEGKEVKQIGEDNYLKMNDKGLVKIISFEGKDLGYYGLIKPNLKSDVFALYEEENPVLTIEEKAYLEAVLRPFKDNVESVSKQSSAFEYIRVVFINISNCNAAFTLPNFKEGTMYKGMETNKEYTLEELGLFQD